MMMVMVIFFSYLLLKPLSDNFGTLEKKWAAVKAQYILSIQNDVIHNFHDDDILPLKLRHRVGDEYEKEKRKR